MDAFWDPTVYVPREMLHPSESSTRKCLVVVISDLFRDGEAKCPRRETKWTAGRVLMTAQERCLVAVDSEEIDISNVPLCWAISVF